MRYVKVRLKNYKGIFNGLGIEELIINLAKCINKILVIKGDNGSGKSTIYGALHIFSDSSDDIIEGVQGEKEIQILDGDILYNVFVLYPVTSKINPKTEKFERGQTKIYIQKYIDNTFVELNPNGNISSYKDVVFSEFNLDPNFIQLSQLSSGNRGLADKTPGDRKKFVSSLLNSVEVYNNINKILTKKSSIFRSMVNSIISKIDNIGDENKLKSTLQSLENRIINLNNQRDGLIIKAAEADSLVKILDPDSSIQQLYTSICTSLDSINLEISKNNQSIDKLCEDLNISDKNIDFIMKSYKDINDNISKLNSDIYVTESSLKNLLSDREVEARTMQLKIQKLESLKSEYNYIDLEKAIEENTYKIKEYENIFNKIGIVNPLNISKEEYISGLNTLKDIKETIDIFKSNMDYEIIQSSILCIQNDINPIDKINLLQEEIDDLNKKIQQNSIDYSFYLGELSKLSTLELRPKGCIINNCSFIEEALDAEKLNPKDNMNRILKEMNLNNEILKQKNIDKSKEESILSCVQYLNIILRNIRNYSKILSKLPNGDIFGNTEVFLNKLINGSNFNEINDLYKYIDYANIFEEYKTIQNMLYNLNADYKVYESKNLIVKELSNDIADIDKKLSKMLDKINDINMSIFSSKKIIVQYESVLPLYDKLILIYNNNKTNELKKQENISQFNTVRDNMIKIQDAINNVNSIQSSINRIIEEINPLVEEKDKLRFGLASLEEYKQEYALYKEKYDKVEVIKKYSGPNKGVQTKFMKMYMGKTLEMTNELISLLFDGEFMLTPYVIDDNEFRIPCIGNGLPHDDISSMSTSQVCMISMVLSFVLLYQSSTKYNILKLDEIDGGLDANNRGQFIHLTNELMSILNTEQCIMISHNSELDLSNTDIIVLKDTTNETYNGNIIYNYNEQIAC